MKPLKKAVVAVASFAALGAAAGIASAGVRPVDPYTDGARLGQVQANAGSVPAGMHRPDGCSDGAYTSTGPHSPFTDASNRASVSAGQVAATLPELLAVARPKDCAPNCGGERQVEGTEGT